MEVKTQRVVAYYIAFICLVLGVVCYAAFPIVEPDEPVRVMFDSTGGAVLFSHKVHVSESGYGLDCVSCHHEDADDPSVCGSCHNGEDSDIDRADALHGQCKGCHEQEDAGPVKCSGCHAM